MWSRIERGSFLNINSTFIIPVQEAGLGMTLVAVAAQMA